MKTALVYIGPARPGVEIESADGCIIVPAGHLADFDPVVAERLLRQRRNWQAAELQTSISPAAPRAGRRRSTSTEVAPADSGAAAGVESTDSLEPAGPLA